MIGSGTFRLEPPRLRTTEDPTSERHATWYELFFDLVFAAAVIELATALADDPTSAVFGRFAGLFVAISWAWTGFAACFITALCLWWIYFDLADTSVVGRGTLGLVFVYGHFPLFPGIGAFAAGTTLAITEVHLDGLEAGARWALAGGLAAFALALVVMHLGAEWTSMRDRSFFARLLLVALLVALAAVGGAVSPLVFALLVMGAVLGQLLLEAFTFPTGAASVLEPPEPALRSGA
jgi:low temperature requirement protein LtrA